MQQGHIQDKTYAQFAFDLVQTTYNTVYNSKGFLMKSL
jgi:hypothetical protein